MVRPSPAHCYIYCTLFAIYSNTSLEVACKKLLRVTCKGAASTKSLHEATLEEDGAIDHLSPNHLRA